MSVHTVSVRWCAALLGAVLVVGGVGCGPSQEEYDEQVRLVADLRSQLEEVNRRQQQTQTELEQMRARNEELTERLGVIGELTNDLEEARRIAAEFERRAQQQQERLAAFRRMLGQFQAMIDSGRLRVRIVRGRMVIEMSSNILFDVGQASLSDEGEETLTEVASVLRTIPNRHFQVAGHTDNVPIRNRRFPSNWELSTQRAVNVVRFLQEQGVNPSFLSAAGQAEFAPAESNDTEEGRQANRRIEIILMPNLDELPDLSGLENAASE